MALTTPRLTWAQTSEVVGASTAAVVLASAKTVILAASWRVLADDVAAGDTYLWAAPPAGVTNEDDRIFVYVGGGTIHAANLGELQTSQAAGVYYGYCPGHAGATPDATDPTAATPISSTTWTKMYINGLHTSITGIFAVYSDEALALYSRLGTADTSPAAFGALALASDDTTSADGDGRIYGLCTGGTTRNPTIMWSYEAAGISQGDWGNGLTTNNQARLVLFDPDSPTTPRIAARNAVSSFRLASEDDMLQLRPAAGATEFRILRDIGLHWANRGTTAREGQIGSLRQIYPERQRVGANIEIRSGPAGSVLEYIIVPSTVTLSQCTGFAS